MQKEKMDLAKLMKYFRMRTTTSQKDLAKKLGFSPNYISNIETGEKTGSLVYMAKFAKLMKLDDSDKAAILNAAAKVKK